MNLVEPRNIELNTDVIGEFLGLNMTDTVKNNQFTDMQNLSSDRFPFIHPRKPRTLVSTLTSATALFSDGLKLATVEGTSFKYDGVVKGTVTAGPKSMVEFNKYIVIFPDKKAYDTVNGTFASFTAPDIDYVTVHMNRIFGVKGQNVYASKLGDHTTWDDFSDLDGTVNDSWAADIAGNGDIKGITAYQNHVVFQTETSMHELYGYKPANFQIQETVRQGVLSNAYCELNNTLYFASPRGIFAFSGGLPRLITQDLEIPFVACVLGTDNKKLFASVYDGTNYHLIVFDPETGLIHKEDSLNVIQFAYLNGYLYALCADGKLYKFGSGTESISWNFVTPFYYDGDAFHDKLVTHIELHAELSTGSSIQVYIDYTGSEFKSIKTYNSTTDRVVKIPVRVRGNKYRLKVTGTGNVLVRAIKRLSIGGRL
ncbi:MAG: hypothetical protein GT601_06025 [Acidaminobacter sp.]|uniref:hypothetical protein n=1 Tax=Acidaminobacter sp. TaxID=1872102 RepID=UPI001384E3DB|nr:hypothetical protein [Acidaminobacter sp.]MZQ97213.1 hypothetical protein [Acidaminobacter sp.]